MKGFWNFCQWVGLLHLVFYALILIWCVICFLVELMEKQYNKLRKKAEDWPGGRL